MEPSPLRKFINRIRHPHLHPQTGGTNLVPIPTDVQKEAKRGIYLMSQGFQGGTATGHARAKQLTGKYIDLESLADMRTWFARHGPDASNGGTSYRGYKLWTQSGSPLSGNLRAPIAWLIWGGDPAYRWLKSRTIQRLLVENFPERRQADSIVRLQSK